MKDKLLFPDIFEAVFILLCLFGVQLFIVQILHYTIGPYNDDLFLGMIISVASYGIVFSWIMHFKNITYRDVLHSSQSPPIKLLFQISAPLIFIVMGIFIFEVEINKILSSIFPIPYYFEKIFSKQTESGFQSGIAVVLLAPFFEEILFRGIILKSFLEQYSIRKSIIASSLIFSAFHLNIYQFVIAFILGVLSGWIYSRTYSLYPCFLIHSFYNSICLIYVGLQRAFDFFPFKQSMSNLESLIFLIFGGVFIMVGMFPLIKNR